MRLLTLPLIGLVPFGLTIQSEACGTPPEKMYLGHEEAIADAEWIARVRADRPLRRETDGKRGYRLKVIEYLKGGGPEIINIESDSEWRTLPLDDEPHPVDSNFHGHHASQFWVQGGRSWNDPDCKIHPGFLFGDFEYLIFGPTQYNVGYENITLTNDLWLQFVRDTLDPGKKAKRPYPLTAAEYFGQVEAVVHFSVTWKKGQISWSETILKGPKRRYAHMLYISPHGQFAYQLDPACSRVVTKPSETRSMEFLAVFEFLPEQTISASDFYGSCTGGNRDGYGGADARGVFSRTGRRIFRISEGVVEFDQWSHGQILSDPETLTLKKVRALTKEKR